MGSKAPQPPPPGVAGWHGRPKSPPPPPPAPPPVNMPAGDRDVRLLARRIEKLELTIGFLRVDMTRLINLLEGES